MRTYNTVPVEFSNSTLLEMLLSGRDVMTLREILDDLLPDPAAFEETSLGVRETPLQVGHNTVIRGLLSKVVGVLEI